VGGPGRIRPTSPAARRTHFSAECRCGWAHGKAISSENFVISVPFVVKKRTSSPEYILPYLCHLQFKNNRINHKKHKRHKRHKNENIRKFCDFCAFCG
jgi:hypothetical protein